MRIRKITADNFKSLVDFKLDLAKFNCLIGLNGSGKSTVLQFIDFLAQQVRGDMKGWLKERSWQQNEIGSRLTAKKNIDFFVELIVGEGSIEVSWRGSFDTSTLHCTSERIEASEFILQVSDGNYSMDWDDGKPAPLENIPFKYEGSILSQLREDLLPQELIDFKNYFESTRSLDLLSPEHLRQRTRVAAGSLGLGGRNLAAFIYEQKVTNQLKLVEQLKRAYPQLEDLHTESQSSWKRLEITEQYEGQEAGSVRQVTTEARHVNDGMLRLIAILSELQSDHQFLLFDEIENGINPELIEFVLNALVSAEQQVLVTTHSPMILNYLSDEDAKAGVTYLYKTPQGATKTIPFFTIPSLAEKLTVMGPGEAFVDTDLTALGEEIEAIAEGQ